MGPIERVTDETAPHHVRNKRLCHCHAWVIDGAMFFLFLVHACVADVVSVSSVYPGRRDAEVMST